jgi:hypothetical protein
MVFFRGTAFFSPLILMIRATLRTLDPSGERRAESDLPDEVADNHAARRDRWADTASSSRKMRRIMPPDLNRQDQMAY